MKYMNRYHDFESFIKDYGNDDPNVKYIVVSGITLEFIRYYNDGSNCCDWGNDDGYSAETYVGRNPSVGDEVDLSTPDEDYFTLTIDEVDRPENKYIEPWVSFCDESVVSEFILDCNCGGDPSYYYGARFDKKIADGVYHWNSFQVPGGSAPGYTYYTPTANPQIGDHVYGSVEGMAQDNSLGCVAEITKRYNKVAYNKKSNWISVEYLPGTGMHYLNITGVGSGFDNSENSEYRVYCEDVGEETIYQGVRLYWGTYYDLYVDEIPCYTYYEIAENDGEWEIEENYRPCE